MILSGLALLLSAAAEPPRPIPAPGRFVSFNHGLTFTAPSGASYCPIANDWAGSDHGTAIFLTRPSVCGPTGFPSSGRSFLPGSIPLISVYYGFDSFDGDGARPPEPRCRLVGMSRLLGRTRPLCRSRDGKMVRVETHALYDAGSPREASFALVTTPARLAGDLATFRTMLASVRTCSVLEKPIYAKGRRIRPPMTTGVGPRCPLHPSFY